MQKHQIKTFDEYETPLYAIRDLLDHWQLENLHIYEPFIGSGHSTKCMRKLGHTVYAPGGDFFYARCAGPQLVLNYQPALQYQEGDPA